MVWGRVLCEQVPFPERDQRGLFTQEGARRCEKGHTCRSGCYLSPGCAKGLHRASPVPLSAPNFYLPKGLLPAFWGAAASTGPRCHPLRGPASQVNPSLLLLACAVGRSRRRGGHAGSPRAALSQHGNNSGTWSCVCSAPTAGHRVQARGGGLGRLVYHLAGPFGKCVMLPRCQQKYQPRRGEASGGALPAGKHTARLHRYLSHGHFLLAERASLLSPESHSASGLCSSADAR